ncbi:MAG: class I tRNA ligase family protein, partial [Candidatus Woesearchaeota archaeon]|nr:class I tRNA ligase family protein [Candidatus Woesearchaeota archaeon]
CISRQRFFGVPFPIWYCAKCGEAMLAEEKQLPVDPLVDRPLKPCKCGSRDFEPEKDVMDTWATSSLTPQIAASLVPELYDKLYPMDLRPQAHDIITFWLFNTVVKSQLHSNTNPWKDAMISGWALDPHGEKMSKSKGNIVEPQEVISKYGADCLRFWSAGSKLGEDMPYQEKDLVTAKKMITKLWNASRFALMHLENYDLKKPKKTNTIDRWLLSKLNKVIKESTESLDVYEYSKAKHEAEKFFWQVLCDNYLEIVKDRIYNPEKYAKEEFESAKFTLYTSLLNVLKLLAPIMPYVTEAIYQLYFAKKENCISIHTSKWPEFDKEMIDEDAEKSGDLLVDILGVVRKVKSEKHLTLKAELKKIVIDCDEKHKTLILPVLNDLKAVSNAREIAFGKETKHITENFQLKIGVEV